jgi:predicted amidohydrolase YtcJ
MDLVERPPPDEATRERRILAAQQALLEAGLTCVHDMGVDLEGAALFARLAERGELALRAVQYLDGEDGITPAMVSACASEEERLHGELAVVGVKLYADGALGSRGAALLEDYADRPGERGHLLTSADELAHDLALCAAGGLQPAIHAIGDAANRLVLDVLEARLQADASFALLRPRIEHAQVVAFADRPRFAALGIVPSMQPSHCTSDGPWAQDRLGPGRIAGAYAWRRLAPDAAALAFGSDFPVEDPSPLAGIYAAVTRQTPQGQPPGGFPDADQRLTLAEALAAFTSGAARAARQEEVRGKLLPGYYADLTVLDRDPFAGPAEELLAAQVKMTVVSGRVVYRREP